MFTYPTKDIVIHFNQSLTSAYSQTHFVMQEANLEHYLEQVKHYADNIDDREERLFRKAAYLLHHLTFDAHIFTDGNKRTALTTTLWFLAENGYIVDFPPDKQLDATKTMKEIAEGKRSISYIGTWLRLFATNLSKNPDLI